MTTTEVHFTSATQTRDIATEADLIRTTDLVKLPKGQAFALLDGNKPYKIRIPWLKQNPNDKLPSSIGQVANNMRERYQSVNDDWYKYKEYFDPISVINTDLKSHQTGFDSFVANELKFIGNPNEF